MKIYNEIITIFNDETQQWDTLYEDSYNYSDQVMLLREATQGEINMYDLNFDGILDQADIDYARSIGMESIAVAIENILAGEEANLDMQAAMEEIETSTLEIIIQGYPPGSPTLDVNKGDTIILDADRSTPNNVSFFWNQLSGAPVILADADSSITSFIVPNQTGILTFKLKITHPTLGQTSRTIQKNVIETGTSLGAPTQSQINMYDLDQDGTLGQSDIDYARLMGQEAIAVAIENILAGQDANLDMQSAMEEITDDRVSYPAGMTLLNMMNVLHAIGYINFEDLDVTNDGIIDMGDGEQILSETGDARPLEFIQAAIAQGNTEVFEIYFPPEGSVSQPLDFPPLLFDAPDYLFVPPGIIKKFKFEEGHEKLTTIKLNQIKYFSGGNSATLNGSDVYTSSLSSLNTYYYYGVTDGDPTSPRFDTQFDVAWGHYAGSGSNTMGDTIKGASEAIYKQYASMLLNEPTGGFYISSGSDIYPGITDFTKDESIYVLNFKRKRFKDQLEEGTWTLVLSGSHQGLGKTIHLTDNSIDKPGGISTRVGRRYDILSGSEGTPAESIFFNRYGWFYPDAGLMIFGEKLGTEIFSSTSPAIGVFNSANNDQNQFMPNTGSNADGKNALRFVNCMRNVDGNALTLYGEKETTDVTYICRIGTQEFNFTTNQTILSSSGNTMRKLEPGRMNSFFSGSDNVATMDGNPHTFITQVQLYIDSGAPVAIAHLSKPLMKNFSKEAYIKVKLSY